MMTVQQLIEALQSMDQETEIVVQDGSILRTPKPEVVGMRKAWDTEEGPLFQEDQNSSTWDHCVVKL